MSNTGNTANQAKRRRKKYRLNKKKFAATIIILLLMAACLAAAAILLPKRVTDTQEAAAFVEGITLPLSDQKDDPAAQMLLEGRTIVVDAGHGGFDPGAIGVDGTYEAELNLAVAKYLQDELIALGAEIIMTRDTDIGLGETQQESLEERGRIIKESSSDIVISIHMNSFEEDPDVCGPLVLFMPGSEQGKKLAEAVQDSMNAVLEPDGTARSQSLYVLKSGNQPSVLVECGYISNAEEERKLNQADYQKRVAEAICEGVEAYFKQA